MEPLLRASLVTLAALSILGGAAAIARPQSAERRVERLSLLFQHGFALAVAVAAAFVSLLEGPAGGDDGRALLLIAAGLLFIVCLHDVVTTRVVFLVVLPLVAGGLLTQVLIVLELVPPSIAGSGAAVVGAFACAGAAVAAAVRRRDLAVPRARALVASQVTALALASLAGVVGAVPFELAPGAWAVPVGVAGAVATAGRLSPSAPPAVRELCAAGVVAVLGAVAAGAAALPLGVAALGVGWAALASLGAFSLVRAALDSRRHHAPSLPAPLTSTPAGLDSAAIVEHGDGTGDLALPSAAALAAMSPLIDDALLRRPGRPRVIARVPARRLLDAALEKARSAQPTRGRRDDLLRVDVVAADSDIDVDGDPADLAEALCAVLDNALRARAQHPDVKVQVHLRGNAAAVTFEVSDVLPEGAEPPASAGIPDAETPFMHPRTDVDRPGLGVSLARARILVERNGGKLLTRTSAEGSFVQVTMPRRMQKGAVGQA